MGLFVLIGLTVVACTQPQTTPAPTPIPPATATPKVAATLTPAFNPVSSARVLPNATPPTTLIPETNPVRQIAPAPPESATQNLGPKAQFTTSAAEGQAPFTVQFGNHSENADAFQWDFGDGTTSTAIAPSNTYTQSGTFTITLTATKQGVTSGSPSTVTGSVSVRPGKLSRLSITPPTATLDPNQLQGFSVQATDEFNNEIKGLNLEWNVVSGAGSIDAEGNLTAGTGAGSYDGGVQVGATYLESSKIATANIVIRPGTLDRLELFLREISLPVDEPLAMDFNATDQYGNEIAGVKVVWNIEKGGSINDTGVLTAGRKSGTFQDTLTAVATHAGYKQTAVATLTVQPGTLAAVTIEPPTLRSTTLGVVADLEARASDRYGNEITSSLRTAWAAEGGFIDGQGHFNAKSKAGSANIHVSIKSEQIVRSTLLNMVWGVDLRNTVLSPADLPVGFQAEDGTCRKDGEVELCTVDYVYKGVEPLEESLSIRSSVFFYPPDSPIPSYFGGPGSIEWLKNQLDLLEGDILEVTEVAIPPHGVESRGYRLTVSSTERSNFVVNAVVFRVPQILAVLLTVSDGRTPIKEALHLTKQLQASLDQELASPAGPTELGNWLGQSPPNGPVTRAKVRGRVNLKPLEEGKYGWPFPLIVSPSKSQFNTSPVKATGPVFISWAAENDPEYIQAPFKVDLYLDSHIVGRWNFDLREGTFDYFTLRAWPDLLEQISLSPGSHTVTLKIDPTNLIAENDETDNTYSVEILVEAESAPPAPLPLVPEKQPNLIPYTPKDWDAPIIAYSKVDDLLLNRLSVDVPTCVRFSLKNVGTSEAQETFLVKLFIDDVLIRWTRYRKGVRVGHTVTWLEWCDLHETAGVTPGKHTLKLEIDAEHIIGESDEDDNVFAQDFIWGTGPVRRVSLQPLTLVRPPIKRATSGLSAKPNLTPFTPPTWDGPVVLQTEKGVFKPNLLIKGMPIYFHWAVKNDSKVDMTQGYKLELRIGGKVLARLDRPPLKAGGIDFQIDGSLSASILDSLSKPNAASQVAAVSLVIDPGDVIIEDNEQDNHFEVEIKVLSHRPAPPSTRYGPDELSAKVSLIEDLLPITRNTIRLDGEPYLADLTETMSAIYFALYGTALKDERLVINILTDSDYDTMVTIRCLDKARESPINKDEEFERCAAALRNSAGFHTTWHDHNRIFIRGERTPAMGITIFAHELGHFRQDLKNPRHLSAEERTLNVKALAEAQAYAHTMVVLRGFEERLGKPLLRYPTSTYNTSYITTRIQKYLAEIDEDEHERGRLLLWSVVLTDNNLVDLKQELVREHRLTLESTKRLFDYVVSIPWEDADAYVDRMLASLDQSLPTIKRISKERLDPGLSGVAISHSAFRQGGLLLP